jgi:hypothetical protein
VTELQRLSSKSSFNSGVCTNVRLSGENSVDLGKGYRFRLLFDDRVQLLRSISVRILDGCGQHRN